jgi:hypothetical protein
MVLVTRYHHGEIVRVADDFPVAVAVSSAFGSLHGGAHLLVPLLVEVVVQRRQGDIGEQRGKDPALRGSGQCFFPVSEFGEDPGGQERFHQRADPLVLDPHS